MTISECLQNTEENRKRLYDMGWTMHSPSTLNYNYITATDKDKVFQGLGRISPPQIEVPKGYRLYVFPESRTNKMLKALR